MELPASDLSHSRVSGPYCIAPGSEKPSATRAAETPAIGPLRAAEGLCRFLEHLKEAESLRLEKPW